MKPQFKYLEFFCDQNYNLLCKSCKNIAVFFRDWNTMASALRTFPEQPLVDFCVNWALINIGFGCSKAGFVFWHWWQIHPNVARPRNPPSGQASSVPEQTATIDHLFNRYFMFHVKSFPKICNLHKFSVNTQPLFWEQLSPNSDLGDATRRCLVEIIIRGYPGEKITCLFGHGLNGVAFLIF